MYYKRHNIKTPLEIAEAESKKNNSNNSNSNKFNEVKEPGFIPIDFKYLPRIKELNKDYNNDSNKEEKEEEKNKKEKKNDSNNKKYLSKRSYMFSAIDRYSRYICLYRNTY